MTTIQQDIDALPPEPDPYCGTNDLATDCPRIRRRDAEIALLVRVLREATIGPLTDPKSYELRYVRGRIDRVLKAVQR